MKNIYLDAKVKTDNALRERLRDAENDHKVLSDITDDLHSLILKAQAFEKQGALAQPALPNEVLSGNNTNLRSSKDLERLTGRDLKGGSLLTLTSLIDALDDLSFNLLRMHSEQAEHCIDKLNTAREEQEKLAQ